MLSCYLYIFFGEISPHIFSPFLNWICLFSYCWVLRVFWLFLEVSPLSGMCFANIFSQSVAHSLFFWMVPFIEQKFLILIQSNIHFFSSRIILTVLYLKTQVNLNFLLLFSRSFIVFVFHLGYWSFWIFVKV